MNRKGLVALGVILVVTAGVWMASGDWANPPWGAIVSVSTPVTPSNLVVWADETGVVVQDGGMGLGDLATTGDVADLQVQIDVVSGRVDVVETQSWTKAESDARYGGTGDVSGLQLQIDNVSGRVDIAQADIDTVSGRVDIAQADIDTVSGRVDIAQADVDAVSGRVDLVETEYVAAGTAVGQATNALYVDGLGAWNKEDNIHGMWVNPTSLGAGTTNYTISPGWCYVDNQIVVHTNGVYVFNMPTSFEIDTNYYIYLTLPASTQGVPYFLTDDDLLAGTFDANTRTPELSSNGTQWHDPMAPQSRLVGYLPTYNPMGMGDGIDAFTNVSGIVWFMDGMLTRLTRAIAWAHPPSGSWELPTDSGATTNYTSTFLPASTKRVLWKYGNGDSDGNEVRCMVSAGELTITTTIYGHLNGYMYAEISPALTKTEWLQYGTNMDTYIYGDSDDDANFTLHILALEMER